MRFFTRSTLPILKWFWVPLLPFFVLGNLVAQIEEIPEALLPLDSDNKVVRQHNFLQFISGKSAANYGFSSIAEQIFKELLQSETEADDEDTMIEARYQLILSLLNQDKTEEAVAYLEGFEDQSTEEYKFVAMLIDYVGGATAAELESHLATLAGADMGTNQVWLNVMRGIILMRKNQLQEARSVFDEALEEAVNAFQRSWIESLVWREEILNGQATESLVISLRSQLDNAVNPLIASQLTQQYAIALNVMGRRNEAVRAIESQLPILGVEYRAQRDRLLMLLAILSGRNSGKTQVAIEEILLRGESQRMRSMAFYYWLSFVDFSDENQTRTLTLLFDAGGEDPLRNEIAYALALSSFYKGNLNQSQARIDSILESDAESSLKQSALRVLIAVCWNQNPSQYRLAAEHLLRLRRLSPDPKEKNKYSLLIADSYYLNGDYENAIPYYNGLMDQTLTPGIQNELLFKITDSMLKLGNVDGARPILERFHDEHPELSELIWGSEWNFNLYLVRNGNLHEAIIRMEELRSSIESVTSAEWTDLAKMRVSWLLAFLNFQNQDYEEALRVIDSAVSTYNGLLTDVQTQMAGIRDELLLLGARNLLALNEREEAMDSILLVRQNGNPETAAASYIIEARYHISKSETSHAQSALMELADLYPESDYAPVALYEAAINVESRVSETSDQEAIALYERISTQFPNHALSFISKLRQGDLLRKTNQFALAISFYENLLTDFRGDSRIYLVEMALGESYLAMGSSRLDYIDQSVQILERVFDRSNLPLEVRLEAGTKAAIGLDKVGRDFRSQDMLWRVITLVEREPALGLNLGASGKYWLARATLMLSDRLIANEARNEVEQLIELAEAMKLPGVNLIKNKL